MTRLSLIAWSAAIVALPAMAQNNGVGLPTRGQPAPGGRIVAGRPLPANPPIAPSQKPAFAGQAGAPAVVTRTPINVEIKTQNLNHPWCLAFIGDGRLIVTEKPGAMRVPDNPFNRDQQAENHTQPEIWSYNHRNPQALTFNPADGSLWDVEHGPDGGDEVNRIVRGANYGWPLVAYGTNYDRSPVDGGRTQMPGTEQPRYFWPAAIGPGGATFYSGDLVPEWRNNLFVGSMVSHHLARLVVQGDRIVGEARLLQDQGQRVRDAVQGPDGALWVITDEADGRLIRLSAR